MARWPSEPSRARWPSEPGPARVLTDPAKPDVQFTTTGVVCCNPFTVHKLIANVAIVLLLTNVGYSLTTLDSLNPVELIVLFFEISYTS